MVPTEEQELQAARLDEEDVVDEERSDGSCEGRDGSHRQSDLQGADEPVANAGATMTPATLVHVCLRSEVVSGGMDRYYEAAPNQSLAGRGQAWPAQ